MFIVLTALSAWAGTLLQYWITSKTWAALVLPTGEGIIRFFSYFTIQTNLIVAICLSSVLVKPGGFFDKSSLQSAVGVYIVVVGLVYHVLLSRLWKPEGLQWVADTLLHSVVPILYILFWLIFTPASNMNVRNIFRWMIYPIFYFGWVLIQAIYTRFYPYPFIDVESIGYRNSLIHALGLLIVFFLLGLLSIWLKKPAKPAT